MLRPIDAFLNTITMYRLVLCELIGLLLVGAILGGFGLISYSPLYLAYSIILIFAVTWSTNRVFAYFFDAPTNPESTYITALILALIIAPPHAFGDLHFIALAFWAAAWAIASKYIFAIKDSHLFNPAAFGVVMTALFLNLSATWWVGTLWMAPFVLIGGFLVIRKTQRFDLVLAFMGTTLAATVLLELTSPSSILTNLREIIVYSPFLFFASVMLTEPMTMPPGRFLRVWYGVLVGFLFVPLVHFGSLYFTPELALIVGNLFAYVVLPKQTTLLTLIEKIKITPTTYEFVFSSKRSLSFEAGQYMEWTLPHEQRDARGVRRYFTIASAPSAHDIRIGVKFYEPMSSFKKSMSSMEVGDTLVASQVAGEFTLPKKDLTQKLVFIAGGIGITPFKSMIEHLVATNDRRDIVLLYANNLAADVAYSDLIKNAEDKIGMRSLSVITHDPSVNQYPTSIDEMLIQKEIPDYKDRYFYLSGPQGMVNAYSDLLAKMHVPTHHIKKDFFPGFA